MFLKKYSKIQCSILIKKKLILFEKESVISPAMLLHYNAYLVSETNVSCLIRLLLKQIHHNYIHKKLIHESTQR